ncbi:MAG TPA: tetratricopeptide repeat protein [Trichormus sp.]
MTKQWLSAFNGDDVKHIAQARAAITSAPNDPDWHEILAICYDQDVQQMHKAVAEAKTALQLKPTSARILSTTAILLLRRSRMREALPLARKAVLIQPENGRAHAALGSCLFEMGEQAEAQIEIEKALKLDKDGWDVNLLASQFYEKSLDEQAGPCLDRLVQNYPQNANSYAARGRYRRKSGDIKGAISDMEKATKLDPRQFELHFQAGNLLASVQRYKEAIAEYSEGIANTPERLPITFCRRAKAYQACGDCAAAIADISMAIKLCNAKVGKPADAWAGESRWLTPKDYKWCWMNRMECYDKLGQTAKAVASAGELLKADPTCDQALQLRQSILRKQGKYAEALGDLNALVKLDSGVQDWYLARGEVLQKLGRSKEAAADFAKAKHLENFGQ